MMADDQETSVSLVVRVKDLASQALDKLTTGFRRLQEVSSGRSNGSSAEVLTKQLQDTAKATDQDIVKVQQLTAAEQKLGDATQRTNSAGQAIDARGRFIGGGARTSPTTPTTTTTTAAATGGRD